jgi:DeoR/GlpR family transcriptional regulator of sugar metabolism
MSVQDRPSWARDPIHAAGGRRHYNSIRQIRAELRRIEIVCFLAESGMSLLVRGTQRALARQFAVSESTISRDLVGILAERDPSRRCPFCGAKALDDEGVRAIEEGHDRFRR